MNYYIDIDIYKIVKDFSMVLQDYEYLLIQKNNKKIKIFDYDSGTAFEVEVYKRKYDKQYTVGDIEPHTEYFFIYKDCMIRMDFHNFNEEELKTFGFIGVDYGKYNPKRVWWK